MRVFGVVIRITLARRPALMSADIFKGKEIIADPVNTDENPSSLEELRNQVCKGADLANFVESHNQSILKNFLAFSPKIFFFAVLERKGRS